MFFLEFDLIKNNVFLMPVMYCDVKRFFGNTVSSKGFQCRNPKEHNCELWRIIFNYKHVWMVRVGLFTLENAIIMHLAILLDIVFRGEFIQNHFKIFSFLLIWDKNFWSHASWLVAKLLCIYSCMNSYV